MRLTNIKPEMIKYGHAGGKALPRLKGKKTRNGILVWDDKMLKEYQYGPDFDWVDEKGAEKFKAGISDRKDKYGGWAKSPEKGETVQWKDDKGRMRKATVYKKGESSLEIVDDMGNHRLVSLTGEPITDKIDYKSMHTGKGPMFGQNEGAPSTSYGGSGETMHPVSSPEDGFHTEKGWEQIQSKTGGREQIDADKTARFKRKKLKQYLEKRKGDALRTES